MPDITVDNRAAAILANIVTTLEAVTVSGAASFVSVAIYEDLATFERVADAMKGVAVGVIGRLPERNDPQDNADQFAERMTIDVAYRFRLDRKPGESESAAMNEMHRLGVLIRKAMMVDPFRNLLAQAVEWSGTLVYPTDVTGPPRLVQNASNAGTYIASVPVVCAWTL